mgnify:CR=1 FL=1
MTKWHSRSRTRALSHSTTWVRTSSCVALTFANGNTKYALGPVGILTFPVVAVGVVPNSELADYSMEIDRTNSGIVVNPELQARADVYVVCSKLPLLPKFLTLGNVNFSNTFCVCAPSLAHVGVFSRLETRPATTTSPPISVSSCAITITRLPAVDWRRSIC